MTGYYTGVGARSAPRDVLALITRIAEAMRARGYRLRSGHADGCDQAFENGARGEADIFLPWPEFNNHTPIAGMAHPTPAPAALKIAAEHHPVWRRLSPGTRALHARNVHQVLGTDLDRPSDMLICWTPRGAGGGGTGQAIRVAKTFDVLVFDLGQFDVRERIIKWLEIDDDG